MAKELQFGRYQIAYKGDKPRELGRGGMGVVYEAYDPGLNRTLALKVLNQSMTGDTEKKRFDREARLMAKLDHPHIVKIFDVGEHQGKPFIAMEYIAGSSLDKMLKQNLPLDQAVAFLRNVAEAVYYAHSQKVVHRDLKPSNVMVQPDGSVKVMDFGLAKEVESGKQSQSLSMSGDLVGTLDYMSPEQADGRLREVDAQSDVYSLGVILYEILAGKTPFTGKTRGNVIYQIMFQEPVLPSQLDPQVSRELEAICLKAMDKEKERRYRNALAFARDIANYQQDRPLEARPVTALTMAWKWVRRHRTLAAASSAVTALFLGCLIAFAVYKNHQANTQSALRQTAVIALDSEKRAKEEANSQRDEANKQRDEANRQRADAGYSAAESKLSESEAELRLAKTYLDRQDYFPAETCRASALKMLASALATLDNTACYNPEQRSRAGVLGSRQRFLDQAAGAMWDYTLAHQPHRSGGEVYDFPDLATPPASAQHWLWKPSAQAWVWPPSQGSWRMVPLFDGTRQATIAWDIGRKEAARTFPFSVQGRAVAFSPSGKWMALGDMRGTLWLWQTDSDNLLTASMPQPAEKEAESAEDALFKVKKKKDGKGETPEIVNIRFSADDRWLCAFSRQQVVLWQLPELKPVWSWQDSDKKATCAFSSDGKWMALAAVSKMEVLLVDLAKVGDAKVTPQILPGRAACLAFGPQDKTLLFADVNDITIVPLDKAARERPITLAGVHSGDIKDIAVSPDGKFFASLGADSRLLLWSLGNLRCMWQAPVAGYLGEFATLMFHPQHEWLAAVSTGGVNLYDFRLAQCQSRFDVRRHPDLGKSGNDWFQLLQSSPIMRNQAGKYVTMAFHPGNTLVFYLMPNLYAWNMDDGKLRHLVQYTDGSQNHLEFSSDGQLLLLRGRYKALVWESSDWQRRLELPLKDKEWSGLIWQPGSHTLVSHAAADAGSTVRFWQIAGKESLSRQAGEIKAVTTDFWKTFDAGGEHMAVVSAGARIEVWRVKGETRSLSVMSLPSQSPILELCFSAPGCLAAGCDNGTLFIVNWQERQVIHRVQFPSSVRRVYYENGRRLYWIQTAGGIYVYPHVDDVQTAAYIDRLYPLPFYAGYPLLTAAMHPGFGKIALALASGDIVVVATTPQKR